VQIGKEIKIYAKYWKGGALLNMCTGSGKTSWTYIKTSELKKIRKYIKD
jgi:hypothetical protein